VAQGLILSLVTFLPVLATISLAPALPIFAEHFKNLPHVNVLVPMLISVPAIAIALISPVAGKLVDKVGRRRILIAGIALYGALGLLPLVIDNLYAILITRIGVGACEGLLMTVGKTLVGDYFTGVRRQRWVGYQAAIDAALGSTTWLMGGIMGAVGWRGPFLLYLVSVPLLLAVIWLIWEPRPSLPVSASKAAAPAARFPWRTMAPLYGLTLFTGAMYFSYPVNIARALTDLGANSSTQIGILTAIASIGTPAGALFYARSKQRSHPIMLAVALTCIGTAFLGIGWSHHYAVATGFGFLEQVGNGIAGPVLVTWMLSALPFEHRGTGMGIWSTFLVAGIFTSPLIFAGIAGYLSGVQNGFTCLGVVSVAAALAIGCSKGLRGSAAAA
jgi:MFS family permease